MSSQKIQYKKLNIEKLIELAQQDDLKALEELIKIEQKNVFATFAYLSNKKEDVSDLTQEALLRIAKNIKTLKNPKNFKSWANQIVTHLYYDELRKNLRKPNTISIDSETEENGDLMLKNLLQDKKCKPNEKCLALEIEEIIRAGINSLPEPFKIVIVLRELQGLSYEEIANTTKSSLGTVKSRIARARTKLQQSLKNYI